MTRYTITLHDKPGSKARYRHALKLLGAESVRIEEKQQEPAQPKSRPDNIPKSDAAKAVADLFGRAHDRPWADAEIAEFRKAIKRGAITLETMTIITKYYKAERAKPEGIHRRDLLTFLRHVEGETDRAMAMASKPARGKSLEWSPPANVVPMQTPEEYERIRAAAKASAAQLRESLRGGVA